MALRTWVVMRGRSGGTASCRARFGYLRGESGGPQPWVTVLTKSAECGLTFAFSELHFQKHVFVSLATVKESSYRLRVTYDGIIDPWFLAKWKISYHPDIPFWTGSVQTVVDIRSR